MATEKTDSLIKKLINDPKYDIREDGTVWIHLKSGWKLTGKAQNSHGYRYVSYQDAELRVHRVVFAKFCGELKRGLLVDHKDGDRLNNAASNLQQITNSENIRKGRGSKLNHAIVKHIRELYASGDYTMRRLGEIYNVTQGNISHVVNERTWF